MLNIVGMIIHHVKDNADACLMQGSHHLLEFPDADIGLVRVGRIATLWYVIVHRIITPVILVVSKTRLIHTAVVIGRQNVNGIDSERLQVLYCPRFGKCEELARMSSSGTVDGEIAMVHLIDYQVGRRLAYRPLVEPPALRISSSHIDDGSSFAIHSHSLRKHTGTLSLTHVEGIEATHQVALHRCIPQAVLILHLNGFQSLSALSVLVDS